MWGSFSLSSSGLKLEVAPTRDAPVVDASGRPIRSLGRMHRKREHHASGQPTLISKTCGVERHRVNIGAARRNRAGVLVFPRPPDIETSSSSDKNRDPRD